MRSEMKYLGLTRSFVVHFDRYASSLPRVERAAAALGCFLPNLGGPAEVVRRLYLGVVRPMVLYGARIWAPAVMTSKCSLSEAEAVQEREATAECHHCGGEEDLAQHMRCAGAIVYTGGVPRFCSAASSPRARSGPRSIAPGVVGVMLKSEKKWKTEACFSEQVIPRKEAAEREQERSEIVRPLNCSRKHKAARLLEMTRDSFKLSWALATGLGSAQLAHG
nr:uncharacterized protein LOC117217791 [Megalopta genalis]